MSGGKGSQQTGSATTTQTNPLAPYVKGAADYLTPYAQDPNRPYTAPPNPLQIAGYQDISNTGNNLAGWPSARQYDAYGNLITGGGTSPAYPGYSTMAAGGSGPQQTLDRVVNRAVNAAGEYADPITGYANAAATGNNANLARMADYANQAVSGTQPNLNQLLAYAQQGGANNNLGLSQLGRVASGDYIGANDANANRVLQNTLDPIKYNYQTAISPQMDAALSSGGRYGSGAQQGLYRSAQQTLGDQLGKTSEQFQFDKYNRERAAQDAAAQQYGSLYNQGTQLGIQGTDATLARQLAALQTGIQGLDTASARALAGYQTGIQGEQAAGNLYNQGLTTAINAANPNLLAQGTGLSGLDTGFRTALTTQEAALRDYNNFAQGQMIPALAQIQAGTGLRDLETSQLREPYDRVGAYLKAISGGGTTGGSSSTQPIFGNPLTSAISGASGAVGLGKELGLGSLFSGGGGAGASALAGLGADYGGGGAALGIADVLGTTAADYAVPAAGKGAASFLPAIFSDRRLKEDDRVIGNIGDLPLHSFRYRGDPETRFGFMADEVAKVDPGAVLDTESGYKAVDYLRAARAAVK